jgi:hypothetical protein
MLVDRQRWQGDASAPRPALLEPADVLLGRYRLEARVAEGWVQLRPQCLQAAIDRAFDIDEFGIDADPGPYHSRPYRRPYFWVPATGLIGTNCMRAFDACRISSTVTPRL